MSFSHDLQYAVALAREAGRGVIEQYGKVDRLLKTNSATTNEAVTEADRAAQRVIVAGLRKKYPGDGLIGEESDDGLEITAEIGDPMGRVWVIDPIDGTNNFIAGLDHFAVCIGLLERGEPVLGVVYDVTRDLVYAAAKGAGAWRGNVPTRVLDTSTSERSLLMMTSNLIDKTGRCPRWAELWLSQTVMKARILGTACLEAVQVAAGIAHGAVTVNGKLWDCVAARGDRDRSGGPGDGARWVADLPVLARQISRREGAVSGRGAEGACGAIEVDSR